MVLHTKVWNKIQTESTMAIQLNLSTTATLRTVESGRCRAREVAVIGGSTGSTVRSLEIKLSLCTTLNIFAVVFASG